MSMGRPGRFRLHVEQLEERAVPTLSGNPTWLTEGPSPSALAGNIQGIAGSPTAGNVTAIAADPTNAARVFLGAANGGIWLSINATSPSPVWTPQTDTQAFLGIGDIAFSPADTTYNTLYAGTATVSGINTGGLNSGRTAGVYKTTNGGATWTQVGRADLAGISIHSIVPTRLANGQVILAGTGQGLYRSINGGTNWNLVTVLDADASAPLSQVIGDPGNDNRFYAALPGQGVFISNDGGQTWKATAAISGAADATRVRLTLHNSAKGNVVYAALLGGSGSTTALAALFRSADQGGSWTSLGSLPAGAFPAGVNPGGQGATDFSFVADPVDPNVVYVGGDRQDKNPNDALGTQGWIAVHYRGVFDPTARSTSWASLEGNGASGTGGHPDSHIMVFDANKNILEGDDGGIYRLTNPSTPATRAWSSVNGNLSVFEFYSVAYDSVNHLLLGGSQDNGSPQQTVMDSLTNWTDQTGGDGFVAQDFNALQQGQPIQSIHYSTAQKLGGFQRVPYNAAGQADAAQPLGLNVQGTDKTLGQFDTIPGFLVPYAVNAVDSNRLIIATTNFLYESRDRGDTLTALGGVQNGAPTGSLNGITALAYGGKVNGAVAPDVVYVGTTERKIYLRSQAATPGITNGLPTGFSLLTAYKGAVPRAIALDPDNWKTTYVVDAQGKVWRTIDGGGSFTEITGNLATPVAGGGFGVSDLSTVAVFPNTAAANDEVVFVGGINGVYATDNATVGASTRWVAFGQKLPNVQVSSVGYDANDNLLWAGTAGRGIWEIKNLSNFAGDQAPVLDLNGAGNHDFAAAFRQAGGAVAIAGPGLTVTDADNNTLSSARIYINNPRDGANEVLDAVVTGTNIAKRYDPVSAMLTLTGSDTLANYQIVLRSLTYSNNAGSPDNTTRRITFQVNDGVAFSAFATCTVTVQGQNGAPAVQAGAQPGQAGTAQFIANGGPTSLKAGVEVVTANQLSFAQVTLVNHPDGAQESLSVDTTGTQITATYDPNSGVLTLVGDDTPANYQAVLDSLMYDDTAPSPNPENRLLTIILNDGHSSSTAAEINLDVVPVNHAPVLLAQPSFQFPELVQDDVSNAGVRVGDLLAGAITDPDHSADLGVAIVGIDNSHGSWQYSTDDGATWTEFVEPSTANATLLADFEENRVRFLPAPGFNGTVANGLAFRAWDQTNGSPQAQPLEDDGSFADTTTNGGKSSFSQAIRAAGIKVAPQSLVVLTDHQRYVIALFQNLLQRPVDGVALSFYSGRLDQGATLFQVANTIVSSQEFHTVEIQQLYQSLLGRQVDPAGLTNWLQVFASGGAIHQVETGLLGSTEYFQRNGGTSAGLVSALYRDILHRAPDPAGQAEAERILNQHVDRGVLAQAIQESPEGLQDEAMKLYTAYLSRPADAMGEQSLVGALRAGIHEETLIALLVASDEYFSRVVSAP